MMYISNFIKPACSLLIAFPLFVVAASSPHTTQANNFAPTCKGAATGKAFCKSAFKGSKVKSCYPIFNQSTTTQLYYVLAEKPYTKGVAQPCKVNNEHFNTKGVNNVEVVNLSNDVIIYNGEIDNNVGLKCDESQCTAWKK